MIMQTKNWYNETMRSFKSNRLSQWLDEWEVIMIKKIKYEIPEIQKNQWLRNLTQIFQSVSEIFSVRFIENVNDDEKSNSEKFQKMTRKLHEALNTQKDECIIQKNIFHASFKEQSDENSSAADNVQETETALLKNNRAWKKMRIQLKTNSSKKC